MNKNYGVAALEGCVCTKGKTLEVDVRAMVRCQSFFAQFLSYFVGHQQGVYPVQLDKN
jgi:hypothetical protein